VDDQQGTPSCPSWQPAPVLLRIQALAPQIVRLDVNVGSHSGFKLLQA
jgi:hypothetical protein